MSMTNEEAIKILENFPIDTRRTGCLEAREALKVAISALLPITREQVVLCKDCQYWQGNNGGYPHPECRWGHDETPDEDDYCSFAERLEVNEDG